MALKFRYKQRRCTGSYRSRPILELKWSTEEGTYSIDDSKLNKYIIDIGKFEGYERPQNISWEDERAENYKQIPGISTGETEVEWRLTPTDNVNAIRNLKNEVSVSPPPERRTARLIDATV